MPLLTRPSSFTALKRLQTSYLWQMRGAFLAFKRAAGFLFLSTTMRGTTNPNWIALRYDPEHVISKPLPGGDGIEKVGQDDSTVQKLSALAFAAVAGGNTDKGGQGGSPAKRLSALALRSLSLQSARSFMLPPSPDPCANDKPSPSHSPAQPQQPPSPPPQASSPVEHRFDVIVVGSGSGGGVIATELVNAGGRCGRCDVTHPASSHTL